MPATLTTTAPHPFDAAFDAGEIAWAGDLPVPVERPKFTPNADFDAAFDAGETAWVADEVWHTA